MGKQARLLTRSRFQNEKLLDHKADEFMAKYEQLCEEYQLAIIPALAYEPNGLTPYLKVIQRVTPKPGQEEGLQKNDWDAEKVN